MNHTKHFLTLGKFLLRVINHVIPLVTHLSPMRPQMKIHDFLRFKNLDATPSPILKFSVTDIDVNEKPNNFLKKNSWYLAAMEQLSTSTAV